MMMAEFVGTTSRLVAVVDPRKVSPCAAKPSRIARMQMGFTDKHQWLLRHCQTPGERYDSGRCHCRPSRPPASPCGWTIRSPAMIIWPVVVYSRSFKGLLALVSVCWLGSSRAPAQSSRPGWGSTPYHDATGTGVTFRVWAPNATGLHVPGEFNGW